MLRPKAAPRPWLCSPRLIAWKAAPSPIIYRAVRSVEPYPSVHPSRMNEKTGTVKGYDAATQRYSVSLDLKKEGGDGDIVPLQLQAEYMTLLERGPGKEASAITVGAPTGNPCGGAASQGNALRKSAEDALKRFHNLVVPQLPMQQATPAAGQWLGMGCQGRPGGPPMTMSMGGAPPGGGPLVGGKSFKGVPGVGGLGGGCMMPGVGHINPQLGMLGFPSSKGGPGCKAGMQMPNMPGSSSDMPVERSPSPCSPLDEIEPHHVLVVWPVPATDTDLISNVLKRITERGTQKSFYVRDGFLYSYLSTEKQVMRCKKNPRGMGSQQS